MLMIKRNEDSGQEPELLTALSTCFNCNLSVYVA
ncbi:Glutamate receptor [Psidium guajava]|nr:Glutamate receptor [Psidium guajava]